ncbi:hypothetical protein JRQ81_018533 [Phrynocephalus forsythii]|uniref:DUF4709 domain-containing protein n=1 Tax=Phrynocephalus forsythii TaxID=171643 RepID=A0A9Q0XS41_9SAUR|nr:hypothetical protein JRQ81_018533 [Phrynocephalus forsythii]
MVSHSWFLANILLKIPDVARRKMARAASIPASANLTQEQDKMAITERAQALQSTRQLSISPNILELLAMPCCLDELEDDYRHSISDNLKIGFAISDHATQTDTSEIGDLKEFIVTTRHLLQFANSLCDEFAMYKNILKVQHEEKIQEHASSLWLAMSDRLKYIEEFYKQKEVKMRQSFQQQLCDVLAILRAQYQKYFCIDNEIDESGEETVAERMARLRNKLEVQDTMIQSLEEELQEYKDRERLPPDRELERELFLQENRELKEQTANLLEKLARFQETVKRREKERADLETEMKCMQERKERDMKTIEKLMTTQEILKLELDREKQRVLAKAREVKEAQDAVAKLMQGSAHAIRKISSVHEDTAEKGRKALKGKAAKGATAKETAVKEVATKAADAAKEAEEKDVAWESDVDRAAERKAFQDEIKRLKKAEQDAKMRAQRLQQDMNHSGRSWQMKFEILKKSLHAIKDEMFLRQSLRHSAKFRRPSLAERTNTLLSTQSPTRRKESFLTGLYMQYPPLVCSLLFVMCVHMSMR